MEKRSLSLKLPTKMKKLRILSLILYVDVGDLYYITYFKAKKRDHTKQAPLFFLQTLIAQINHSHDLDIKVAT